MKHVRLKNTLAAIGFLASGGALSPFIYAQQPTTTSTAATTTADDHRPNPRFEGLWVWKSKYVSDPAEQDKLIAFCQRNGFNRLLVQIPWKPGTAQDFRPKAGEQPTTGTALHPEIDFSTEFARLIAEAAKSHIAIEALDGNPNMGDTIHRAETLATVDAILDFNKSLPADARFVGIHWDIEPYSRPEMKINANRPAIEAEYLDTLAQAKQKLIDAGSPMTLSVDIPMWYDRRNSPEDNFVLTYKGETKNFHMFIQDLTDYVGIMSYRQKALGHNSAFDETANEIAYASKIGKFACPAFETTLQKTEPTITFYGKGAEKFQEQRHALEDALKDNPGFGGMFIHQYPAVTAILEPDHPAD